jgi:hypothetical protein
MAAKDIHNEMLPIYGEHECHVKESLIGLISSLKGEQLSKTNIESVGWWGLPHRQTFQGLVIRWDKCLNLYGDYA